MVSKTRDIIGNPRIKGNLNILDPMNHKNPMNKTLTQTDSMVEYLLQKLGSPDHVPLYRKVAWKLPDDTIRRLVAASIERKATNPRAYFVACVKREKQYYA